METLMVATPTDSEKNWAVAIHLSVFLGFVLPVFGFLAPIFFWKIKGEESKFLDEQGREASNLALSGFLPFTLLLFISIAVAFLLPKIQPDWNPMAVMVGMILLDCLILAVFLTWMISSILAALSASKGNQYQPKFVFRFFKSGA